MALAQMQLIQSLGEAMAWFEREQQWGVNPKELKHLVGRIGELYAAVLTNGQMALKVDQPGYDVVSAEGERVSVKTTAKMEPGGMISFNPATLGEVDRVMILRVNTEEMQVALLLDAPVAGAMSLMTGLDTPGRAGVAVSKVVRAAKPASELKTVRSAVHGRDRVCELENGSIEVYVGGEPAPVVKPELRRIAAALGLGLLNGAGNPYNTRQLGSQIINTLAPPG